MVKRAVLTWIAFVILAVIILPLVITGLWGGFSSADGGDVLEAERLVPEEDVMLSELEEYVMGVVAAEMPAAFPIEALKAQAVAARTYEVRKMQEAGRDNVLYDIGQAYISPKEQREKWGDHYDTYSKKLRQAVKETEGEIIVYENEPILAVFHAQSAGKTEASENVWTAALPYLKSVDSSGDLTAPDNTVRTEISPKELYDSIKSRGEPAEGEENLSVEILERSDAGYVKKVRVGGMIFTGRELRELLGLRSAYFNVAKNENSFVFETRGYGHGAGMSQYGAAALAEEGMRYKEILTYYYQGVSFANIA